MVRGAAVGDPGFANPLLSREDRRIRGLTDLRVTRFDDRVDEVAALLVRQESTLHRIDRDLLEIIQGQPEGVRGSLEFLGHAGPAHQPVVGVERDAKLLLKKNLEWMLRQTLCSAGMHIADKTNLQWDAFVEHVLSEIS